MEARGIDSLILFQQIGDIPPTFAVAMIKKFCTGDSRNLVLVQNQERKGLK